MKKTKNQSTKRVNSNSKKARGVIRHEIQTFFGPSSGRGDGTTLENMKHAADSANGGFLPSKRGVPAYKKAAHLVDGAYLAIVDQDVMLSKIYGKKKVATWDWDKRHETYKHLIAREYERMLDEKARSPKRSTAAKKPASKRPPVKKGK